MPLLIHALGSMVVQPNRQDTDEKLHPTVYVDVITYSCPNLDVGLVKLLVK